MRKSRRRKKRQGVPIRDKARGVSVVKGKVVDVLKLSPSFGKPMVAPGILPLQEIGFETTSPKGSVATDFVKDWLPQGQGWILDLDGMCHIDLCLYVVSIGYHLVSYGSVPLASHIPELAYVRYVQGDLETDREFDQVLNLLAVSQRRGDEDLQVMRKLHALLKPRGRQYLVVPVGRDAIVGNKHRVYGERLAELLADYNVLQAKYWRRQVVGWEECSQGRAMDMASVEGDDIPRALAGFVLQKES